MTPASCGRIIGSMRPLDLMGMVLALVLVGCGGVDGAEAMFGPDETPAGIDGTGGSSAHDAGTDAGSPVTLTVTAPAAMVYSDGVGTYIPQGSFQLTVHAHQASKVSLGAFSIEDAAHAVVFVAALPVESTTTFPVTVKANGDIVADFTFGNVILDSNALVPLCAASGLVIKATVVDSLVGTSTVAFSPVFHPNCQQ